MCLQAALDKACDAIKTGGVSELHFANWADYVSVTEDVDGKVTAITMQPATVFYEFNAKANSIQFVEDFTNEGGFQATQTLTQVWESFDQTQRNQIMDMAACNCGMICIHKENTGKRYIWGYKKTEEAYLFTGNRDSGTAKSDTNQVTPVVQALATELAREFTGVIPV
jgi:hypothetical protein